MKQSDPVAPAFYHHLMNAVYQGNRQVIRDILARLSVEKQRKVLAHQNFSCFLEAVENDQTEILEDLFKWAHKAFDKTTFINCHYRVLCKSIDLGYYQPALKALKNSFYPECISLAVCDEDYRNLNKAAKHPNRSLLKLLLAYAYSLLDAIKEEQFLSCKVKAALKEPAFKSEIAELRVTLGLQRPNPKLEHPKESAAALRFSYPIIKSPTAEEIPLTAFVLNLNPLVIIDAKITKAENKACEKTQAQVISSSRS
jgi:hypothetical protein